MKTLDLIDKCKQLWPEVFDDVVDDDPGSTPDKIAKVRSKLLGHARVKCCLCKDCELYQNAVLGNTDRHYVVWGDGVVTAPIMLIGNSIDDVSAQTSKPFANISANKAEGKTNLNLCIETAGLSRFDGDSISEVMAPLYIVHTKKCPGPSGADFEPCYKWLQIQMFLVQPQVIIAMGSIAAEMLFGKIVKAPKCNHEFKEGNIVNLRRANRIPSNTTKVLVCGSPNISNITAVSDEHKFYALRTLEAALIAAKKEVIKNNGYTVCN